MRMFNVLIFYVTSVEIPKMLLTTFGMIFNIKNRILKSENFFGDLHETIKVKF